MLVILINIPYKYKGNFGDIVFRPFGYVRYSYILKEVRLNSIFE